jgi:ABC-type transport system involved in multi-copper enzyme maturation permease subunit
VRRALTIAHLTFLEARRRKIVVAAIIGAALFVVVYGTALHFIAPQLAQAGPERVPFMVFITQAGLYVANFLTIAVAVLLPLDTLSGEIGSGVMQTIASKPIHRAEILLGKWLAFLGMVAVYLAVTAGGVLLVVRGILGYSPPNVATGLPLMLLGAMLMVTVAIAGGTRLTTVTNGIVAFAFYGIAFIGGWVEQIGTFTAADSARYIGTGISLVSPVDTLWRRAAFEMQPPITRALPIGPFTLGNVPSGAMIAWAAGFLVALLLVALALFRRRPL